MLLLQRKFLTSQILLACSQGNKARGFLNWGKRKRTLDRVQYCLQIGCQAVRLCYGCSFTYISHCHVQYRCLLPYSWSHTYHFPPGLLANFLSLLFGTVVSLLWACISSFPFFFFWYAFLHVSHVTIPTTR